MIFKPLKTLKMVAATALMSGILIAGLFLPACKEKNTIELLNVSYDPTREFYEDYNKAFSAYWEDKTGDQVTIKQSHGGSGKQARAVIDGLEADVVTLALWYDVNALYDKGKLIPEDWSKRLENNSAPYTSTIVFLVRKGNPKGIKDWNDLIKPGVEVITPNPKTSGGARLNYLAAWGYVLKKELGDFSKLNKPEFKKEVKAAQDKARKFVSELFKHVPLLDSGARGSTITFVQREIGDVLLAWENEAFLAVTKLGPEKLDIVIPSISILAEPSVSVVDTFVDKHGTREIAENYLKYLYSPAGQELAAKHFYRPSKPEIVNKKELLERFPRLERFSVDEVFGGWEVLHKLHFADGGIFDQMYTATEK